MDHSQKYYCLVKLRRAKRKVVWKFFSACSFLRRTSAVHANMYNKMNSVACLKLFFLVLQPVDEDFYGLLCIIGKHSVEHVFLKAVFVF